MFAKTSNRLDRVRLGALSVLFSALLLAIVLVPASTAEARVFTDVGPDDWFHEAVETLKVQGAIGGYEDGTFRPYASVTRAQFAVMVAGVLHLEPGDGSVFNDVSAGDWFAGAVGALRRIGVVQGSSGLYLPGNEISRQQAASLTVRALAYRLSLEAGAQVTGSTVTDDPRGQARSAVVLMTDSAQAAAWLQGFKDRGSIAAVHALSVANAYRLGIMSGSTDQRFYPLRNLTRAQAAGVLYRALLSPLTMRTEPPARVEADPTYATLKQGDRGPAVMWLQRRLAELRYRPGAVNGIFGSETSQAVMAFQKVEGLSRTGVASTAMQRRLAVANTPSPRKVVRGTRVEVDLSRQVLFLVEAGRVKSIIPIASGREGMRTPTGTFSIQRKLPYWRQSNLGMLYKPAYFYRGYAIHGAHSVPAQPASHGCVRVHVATMDWLYPLLPIGTRVDIYN